MTPTFTGIEARGRFWPPVTPLGGGDTHVQVAGALERQHEEERAGTADPATHAEERVDLREELEEEEQQQGNADDDDDD